MNSTRLLARIKLRETERQRDRLEAAYDSIEANAAEAATPLDRLRALHEGLKGITFAQKPLHPEVANLDALFLSDNLGSAPPELIDDRTRLLERELAQGRLRAEFTFAFGCILSEWSETEPETGEDDPLARLWQDPPTLDSAFLDGIVGSNQRIFDEITDEVAVFGSSIANKPAEKEEVVRLLQRIAMDFYSSPELRREASAVAGNPTHINEYAGALTILLEHLGDWDWPEEGVPLHAVWARVKYRPHLEEDLITALFLQLIGMRWAGFFAGILSWAALSDFDDTFVPVEPPTSITSEIRERRLSAQSNRFMCATAGYTGDDASTHGDLGGDALVGMFETIERERRFRETAFPETPPYLVQMDLRDFYPSVSHELVGLVLSRLGVPDSWLDFFSKFLGAKVQYRDEVRTVRGGLVLQHLLVDAFAECVLFFLDLHVYRSSGVELIRAVDDMWIVADSHEQAVEATRAVESFCAACGLATNPDKSGSVRMGSDTPLTNLPEDRPRWGLLRLQPDGTWQIDEAAFARIETILREQIEQTPSVLGLVNCYNGYLGYITRHLALTVKLPGDHLRRMAQRLDRMHSNLMGPGHGIIEEIQHRLSTSIADDRLRERGFPTALLYWPITAGGLALDHPLLHVAKFVGSSQSMSRLAPPNRERIRAALWRRKTSPRQQRLHGQELDQFINALEPTTLNRPELHAEYLDAVEHDPKSLPSEHDIDLVVAASWGRFYRRIVLGNSEQGPSKLPAMERLVEDFIKRGGEVSGKDQPGLSAYWRWVVYSYGPSLLDALGTFRFLMTELVPLQLILENLQSATNEAEPGEGAPPQNPPSERRRPTERKRPDPPPPPGDAGDDIPF